MRRGRQSQRLTDEQVKTLRRIQQSHRLSIPAFAKFLGAPFDWRVLTRALGRKRVWQLNYNYLMRWLQIYEQQEAAPAAEESREPAQPVSRK